MNLFETHRDLLEKTIQSIHKGLFFNQYAELPTDEIYGENSISEGYQKFKSHINRKFEGLRQAMPGEWEGEEESPFLRQPLNILYPTFDILTLIKRAKTQFHKWRRISPEKRAGLLLESLDRISRRFFEIAYATMHTTGMSYPMAFQVSGPHAAQRALNAIASGYEALNRYPDSRSESIIQNEFGVKLSKSWIPVPKGISLIIGCSHFPSRDTTPSIYASLITGNPVVVKPHSFSVLPVAIVVSEIQKVLSEHGFDPDICQLAVDSDDEHFIKSLVEHPDIKLVDFKGNCALVDYLESIRGKMVFSERFSINSVIVDSVEDIREVIRQIVVSLSMYSGQMNNTPQNIFIPDEGILTRDGRINYEDFIESFLKELDELVHHEKGAQVLGAIQNGSLPGTIEKLEKTNGRLLYKATPYDHPEYRNARTLSPMVMELNPMQTEIYQKEHFGPVCFIIKTKNSIHSLELASETAGKRGSLFCSAFTINEQFKEMVMDKITLTNTPVTFNMVGNTYLEPGESIDNFHMTGGNTASKASASNLDFVLQRFTWVSCKQPVYDEAQVRDQI